MWNAEQAALKKPENHKSTLVSRINEETEMEDENFSRILIHQSDLERTN